MDVLLECVGGAYFGGECAEGANVPYVAYVVVFDNPFIACDPDITKAPEEGT
jgi:hypothetical protein